MNPANPADRWIRRYGPVGDARLRLFCFHFAGGSASMYRDWPGHLPSDVSVEAVLLPGRDNRFREPAYDAMGLLVDAIAGALETLLDRPYALLGYSMGAQVAFNVAHALRERGAPAARHLFVGASPGPRLEREVPAWDQDDDALVAYMRDMGGTPPQFLANPDLLELMLPTLRADLTAVATWPYRPRPPLDMPIHAFSGDDDASASPEKMAAWGPETAHHFTLTALPGAHFFIENAVPDVAGAIAADLTQSIGA